MHPIIRTRPLSSSLLATRRAILTRYTPPTALPAASHPRLYSYGGYGDGGGDPRADNPVEQGESNPATEELEHPGTKPTKPAKPPHQQQEDGSEPSRSKPSSGEGSPTMKSEKNDVTNEATKVRPENQSEEVRRHNEDVVRRHEGDVGRDKQAGKE